LTAGQTGRGICSWNCARAFTWHLRRGQELQLRLSLKTHQRIRSRGYWTSYPLWCRLRVMNHRMMKH